MSCQVVEAAGEVEAVALGEDGLGCFGFGHVSKADGFLNSR